MKKKRTHSEQSRRGVLLRWAKTPKKDRGKFVGHDGGRPRIYPPCPKYKGHVFSPTTGRCPCGFTRPTKRSK